MAIFTESHDGEIQLAPASADDFQCIPHGSGEKERGIGAEKRSSYHRLDVGVACVKKRRPCLHWLIPLTAKAKMETAPHALSFILFAALSHVVPARPPMGFSARYFRKTSSRHTPPSQSGVSQIRWLFRARQI